MTISFDKTTCDNHTPVMQQYLIKVPEFHGQMRT
jgi:hypothetical protein